MNVRTYLNITGTNALIAFVLYVYFELSQAEPFGFVFLGLFVLFSILILIDIMDGEMKDKGIIHFKKNKSIKVFNFFSKNKQ